MVMEFFRFKTAYHTQEFYRNFTTNLLLLGVVSSGVTVIMGLFLSREEGYDSHILSWHKWSGISVFFIASTIYTSRNSGWYRATVAKTGAVITVLCLVMAGHFGAALTHGDNFIWKPVLAYSHQVIPLEEAVLFDHVIKPVFEKKCVGCHNIDKLKGQLMLVDSASVMKGGKSGKLLRPGKPDSSLLVWRIHLPLDDKKHMPPSGKTQLAPDETALLYQWIKSGALFSKKVTSLPLRDSLRMLATTFLLPDEKSEVFHFTAADETTLKKLNTNYCVISPLAKQSPALTVNIYNPDAYSAETLNELRDVKIQIVSLELSKLPVKDADLKYITQFENLRRLNLNFTDVTGVGLKALQTLQHLRSLSLSGTKVNYQDLQQYIPSLKSLQTLAVWHTDLSPAEINQLKLANRNIDFLSGFNDDGSHPIKLNTPQVKNKSVVFEESLDLQLFHPVKGVEMRFTTDGSDPDSTSILFKGETILKESTAIKVRAYKRGWLSSNVSVLNVYKSGNKPDTVILESALNRVHPANGAKTFFDHQLGTFNANSPAWANNWAGFIKHDMVLLLAFKNPRMISSVALNTLVETETFIFPPTAIEIWGGPSEAKMKLVARITPAKPNSYSKPFIRLVDCKFSPQRFSYLRIIAKPVMKLPSWHKSKDKPALLLVDEIFIN
jgi:hypothetical protein